MEFDISQLAAMIGFFLVIGKALYTFSSSEDRLVGKLTALVEVLAKRDLNGDGHIGNPPRGAAVPDRR